MKVEFYRRRRGGSSKEAMDGKVEMFIVAESDAEQMALREFYKQVANGRSAIRCGVTIGDGENAALGPERLGLSVDSLSLGDRDEAAVQEKVNGDISIPGAVPAGAGNPPDAPVR